MSDRDIRCPRPIDDEVLAALWSRVRRDRFHDTPSWIRALRAEHWFSTERKRYERR